MQMERKSSRTLEEVAAAALALPVADRIRLLAALKAIPGSEVTPAQFVEPGGATESDRAIPASQEKPKSHP